MASVPVDDAGMASAMNDLSRELGIVGGIAILGSLVASLYRTDVKGAIEGLVSPDVAGKIGDGMGSVSAETAGLSPTLAASVQQAANQSFVDALNVGYLAAAGLIVLPLAVAVWHVPKDLRVSQADAPDLEPALASTGLPPSVPVSLPAGVPEPEPLPDS